ncbi:polysaccharide biosynthesis protein [Sulfitobacter pacificus]|uniref:polysaccharide biosynthesis protein n=1 Tax=Sulfitobacter pacificus TaxID=1499314 RepID=UPI003109F397
MVKILHLQSMTRRSKRFLFLIVDSLIVPFSLYCAFALRYGTLWPQQQLSQSWALFAVMLVAGVALIVFFRLPYIKLHSFENQAMQRIAWVSVLLGLCAMITSYLLAMQAPRSVPLIFGAFFFLGAISMRIIALAVLTRSLNQHAERRPVAIYGAGAAGIQLAAALRQSHEARPVFFIDDNPNLHGLMITGLAVYSPEKLEKLLRKHEVHSVLMAMPSLPHARQQALLNKLSSLPVDVQILPSYIDMMAGKGMAKSFRTVPPDALLGRDKVALDTPEIAKTYAGRVVMVTGAGGSIGSELCRQLVNCNPARIILYEQGEYQLYSIDRDLAPMAALAGIPVVTRLGSVTNKARVTGVIEQEGVEIILHAAAYKHVPLVEHNELEGVRNNVLGTQVVAEAARAAQIERFILVSTDKAVRPTNIMGASKRMAELVIQDLQTRSEVTKFSMVRFGNVLGSSGSVLPLFQKQIAAGGPVTVTHAEVTRFFMTIPEAARLVLLAGAYAKGGDVFVLNMGEPKKIMDIAKQMILLSGRTVKDPVTGKGDISIEITGLRPGEKLYEELLIDDDSLCPTPHPKILCAEEAMLSQIEVASMLNEVNQSIDTADTLRLRRLIQKRVEGYRPPPSTERLIS